MLCLMSIFTFFENRLNPYPKVNLPIPKNQGLFAFLWACSQGARGWIFLRALLSIALGVFGSLLFAWVGDVVDWLTTYTPATLMQEKG